MRQQRFAGLLLVLSLSFGAKLVSAEDAATFRSHTPMRPLATASKRPLGQGSAYYVDPTKGNDRNTGSRTEPFQTISRAVERLQAGDTVYLRGGTYYEHVTLGAKSSQSQFCRAVR
jgi:hypothetical protein